MKKIVLLVFLGVFSNVQAQFKIGKNTKQISVKNNLEIESISGRKIVVSKDSSKMGLGIEDPSNLLHIKAAQNPLRLEGLSKGDSIEGVLTVNDSGIVRKVSSLNLGAAYEPWFNVATNRGATLNTQNIYQMGNVGIGTTLPTSKLYVSDSINNIAFQSLVTIDANPANLAGNGFNETNPNLAKMSSGIQFLGWNGRKEGGIFRQTGSDFKSHLLFTVNNVNDVAMVINENKYVGIGTIMPIARFEVNSPSSDILTGGMTARIYNPATAATNNFAGIQFKSSPGNSSWKIGANQDSSNAIEQSFYFLNSYNGASFASKMMIASNTGNVGIGTNAPLSKLHVLEPINNSAFQSVLTLEANPASLLANGFNGVNPDLAKMSSGIQFIGWNGRKEGGIFRQTGSGSKSHMLFTVNTTNDVALVINENRNIGIGTTAPTSRLELNSGTANTSGLKFTQLTAASATISTANTNSIGVNATGEVVVLGTSKRAEPLALNATFDITVSTFASYKVTVGGCDGSFRTFADEYIIALANNFGKLSVAQIGGVFSLGGAQIMQSANDVGSVTLTPTHGKYSITFNASGGSNVITTKALTALPIIVTKTQSLW